MTCLFCLFRRIYFDNINVLLTHLMWFTNGEEKHFGQSISCWFCQLSWDAWPFDFSVSVVVRRMYYWDQTKQNPDSCELYGVFVFIRARQKDYINEHGRRNYVLERKTSFLEGCCSWRNRFSGFLFRSGCLDLLHDSDSTGDQINKPRQLRAVRGFLMST